MRGGLDWPGLLRVGIGPPRLGGLGLTPAQFWALTPAELSLMLGIDPGGGGVMTRDRLAELAARYPDRPGHNST
ncbi:MULTISPECIES: phage tail assembly chaperone [unclassified Paracoccus (in: a-proteobacteria)]|uniref:phage tail assembly chaperone n=1 Tax=unclassified Paracoccus (in: a-proteobacteria) TaxID=2688777 RepID=UPI0012B299B1|nr:MULTISPECIES: phage tail assembly chaperone [unclassified Paracoccus (in: a-proteobacteria)]UXU76249.1 phage tail assembly chaperone [Paracoccus sp. SMMA_5]UXU82139.1 phage tail assembly chaperone [Paracoccus sp. SMMA_5_TC]